MKITNKTIFLTALSSVILTVVNPVFAETRIELDHETPTFENKELTMSAVKVLVNYKPFNVEQGDSFEDKNLSYRIFYDGVEQSEREASTLYMGSIFLEDLDKNNLPEIIVSTYSGGAHCCTNFQIYTWQKDRFIETETGYLDGYGGEFKDLNGDGKIELVMADNAFLYRFSGYASSFPPTQILSFNNGEFKNVTRQYSQELKSTVWQMYQAFVEAKKESYELNGILAGYVAQKILLGGYEEGWKFMLANYDRTSDWGLEIYRGEKVVGRYPDFPTALRAFLIEESYLDKNVKP
jgi:hypothetical protein